MTAEFVITTSVGPADILHRLALGVEPRNAVTENPTGGAVRVGQEVPPHLRPRPARFETYWPCLDFETNGTARFKLRHAIGGPNRIKVNGDGSPPSITVRIDDVSRRFVPRRFRLPVWTRIELERADPTPTAAAPGPYISMESRLLRPYLLPGSSYPIARGTTVIRGSVVSGGQPVRWPRLIARGPGNVGVGAAHCDEHGEFVLIVTGLGTMPQPAPKEIDVVLSVYAVPPAQATPPDPDDRLADLVVEQLNRPFPADSAVLRGLSVPAGYVKSADDVTVTVQIGKSLALRPPIVFQP
jgi:hypothetical protein